MMYLEGAEYDYFKGSSLEWGTFNFPSMPGGKGDQSQLTGAPEGFMIAKNSKHPEEAVKLFKFLLSEAMGVEWTNQTGELTAIKGGVDKSSAPDSVKEMANNIAASSEMTPWLDNALDQRLVSTYLSGNLAASRWTEDADRCHAGGSGDRQEGPRLSLLVPVGSPGPTGPPRRRR